MANTIYGVNNYYSMVSSPFSSIKQAPIVNMAYSNTAIKASTQAFAKKISSTTSSYLTNLSTNMNELKASAKPLIAKGVSSSLEQKAVTSADTTTVTGTADSNASKKDYTINVKELAATQINSGSKLNSNDSTTMAVGINTFNIGIGESSKNISIAIDEKDTNKTALEKMAAAINYSKAGVTASVITDAKTGTSSLKVESLKTGKDNTFTITDVKGNSTVAAGISAISQNAKNAEYSVNGVNYSSKENTIALDNGKVKIDLHKADNKDIKLSVDTNTEAIKNDIKKLIESYNKAISFSESNENRFGGAKKLGDELKAIANTRKHSLENIGISISEQGKLSIDEKKLDTSLKSNIGSVKDILGGYSGIGEKLYNEANKVLSSPMQYSKPSEAGIDFNNFYRYMQSAQKGSVQNMYTGLVFDMML